MSVRFLIVVDGFVENIVVAETKECLSGYTGAVLQSEDLAGVCMGWKLVDGHFVDPYDEATIAVSG